MILNKMMDPQQTPVEDEDKCISFLYDRFARAATVSNVQDAESHIQWCAAIQTQLVKLIHGLSTKQHIHRAIDRNTEGGCDLEFVESDYSDLVEFLSGLGVSVSEMVGRLESAKAGIPRAGIQDASNAPR